MMARTGLTNSFIDKKKIAGFLAKILFSAAILYAVFSMIEFGTLRNTIESADVKILAFAVLLTPLSLSLRVFRFEWILNKGEKLVSFIDAYRIILVGTALNMFLPAFSGDVLKAYYGYKRHGIKEEMFSASFIDKLFGFSSLFLLGMFSALVTGMREAFVISLACFLLSYLPVFFPRIVPWPLLNRIIHVFSSKSLDPKKMLAGSVLDRKLTSRLALVSVAGWMATYMQFYLICRAFYVDVSLVQALALAPLIHLARAFPLTVNGLGSQEVVITYLFGLMGVAPAASVLVSLFFTIMLVVLPGLFGLALLMPDFWSFRRN